MSRCFCLDRSCMPTIQQKYDCMLASCYFRQLMSFSDVDALRKTSMVLKIVMILITSVMMERPVKTANAKWQRGEAVKAKNAGASDDEAVAHGTTAGQIGDAAVTN